MAFRGVGWGRTGRAGRAVRGWSTATVVLVTTACASGPPAGVLPPPNENGVVGEWVPSGGLRRSYELHLPSTLADGREYPLVIGFHGVGSSAAEFHDLIHPDTATSQGGFVAVYPDGYEQSWNIGCPACSPAARDGIDDVAFIESLIAQLDAELPINTNQVFLFGHSLGAQFVYEYACKSRVPPAGIASVSGLWLRRSSATCASVAPLSVVMIHGDRDRVLPFEGPLNNISALSVPEAFERWSELLQCTTAPIVTGGSDRSGDGTAIETTVATGCPAGSSVVVHRVGGGGHGWPGPVRPILSFGPHSWNIDALAEVLLSFSERVRADVIRN